MSPASGKWYTNLTNNNLSNAGIPTVKKITDLYAIKKSGFYYYDAGATNAPMSSRGGMIVANYLSDSWISLTVVPYASSKIYTNTKYNNTWVGWAESATKDDLNTVLMYRGVITGDLNRGRNLVIAPGIYSIQSVSTITNGPSDFGGWGIFVQFPDNLFSQMILNSPNYIKFRKYSGQNPSWGAW